MAKEGFVDDEVQVGPKVIPEDEWMTKKAEGIERLYVRAIACLEDVIRRELQGNQISLLEIGPLGMIDPEVFKLFPEAPRHVAPIKIFSEKHPEAHCLGVGFLALKGKELEIGDVPYIRATIGIDKDVDQKINKALGAMPNIIYGQHVMENSPSGGTTIAPHKIFEFAAEILPDGGLLVIDNAFGTLGTISRQNHLPHTAQMCHVYTYEYTEKEFVNKKARKFGIFVYKKK